MDNDLRFNLISHLLDSQQLRSDDDLEDLALKSLGKHTQDYDTILRNYSTHVEKTLQHKRIMKVIFFGLSVFTMLSCVALIVVCIGILLFNIPKENFDVIDYIAPTITAITSFLTVYVIIPKIIAKYLFNSKEETAMKDIITSIQNYDKFLRDSLHQKDNDTIEKDENE